MGRGYQESGQSLVKHYNKNFWQAMKSGFSQGTIQSGTEINLWQAPTMVRV